MQDGVRVTDDVVQSRRLAKIVGLVFVVLVVRFCFAVVFSPRRPTLLSPGGGEAALQTAPGAHHYRLIGIEIRSASADAVVYDLVKLGDGSSAQSTLDKVPHHLQLDRCLVTAFPAQTLKRGVALN